MASLIRRLLRRLRLFWALCMAFLRRRLAIGERGSKRRQAVAFRATGFECIGKVAQDLRNSVHLYGAPHLFAALDA